MQRIWRSGGALLCLWLACLAAVTLLDGPTWEAVVDGLTLLVLGLALLHGRRCA